MSRSLPHTPRKSLQSRCPEWARPILSALAVFAAALPAAAQPPAGSGFWLRDEVRATEFREQLSTRTASADYTSYTAHALPLGSTVRRQPSGPLTGRIVFAMAGHGWTWSYTGQGWYTQRPATHGMIEDLGNIDQMHIFAHYCFNAGATVVPLRPIDHQPHERILDNEGRHAEFFGEWYAGSGPAWFGLPRPGVPYAVAPVSLEETAVARFRPYIPQDGDYPVYVWSSDGPDRVNQTYRIIHSGGLAEVQVDHRRVGKGWVWVGTWHFNEGLGGFVEISNQTGDPYLVRARHVVVADAVRFGNGRGDVNRGGGISGYLREEEGDCYWVQRSLSPSADPRLYTAIDDGAATVRTPPQTAAYMNRETEGSFFDRLYLSYHSNAHTGAARGVVSLFNRNEEQRPTHQESLADLTAREMSRQMELRAPFTEPAWAMRGRFTYNGINFGELRRDYLQDEMSATIFENAFHDNAEDARFLLHPRARKGMALASLRGVLRWLDAHDPSPDSPRALAPDVPARLAAAPLSPTSVRLTWELPAADDLVGGETEVVRVYFSRNGYGFDGGRDVPRGSQTQLDGLDLSTSLYIRITARGRGGESAPSETAVVRAAPAGAPRILIANGYNSLDWSHNQRQAMGPGLGSASGPSNVIQRVRPKLSNARNYAVPLATALESTTVSLTYCAADYLPAATLSEYDAVFLLLGRQRAADGILPDDQLAAVRNYVRGGGRLVVNGTDVASALADREDAASLLGAKVLESNSTHRTVAAVPGSPLAGLPNFRLPDDWTFVYDPLPLDALDPEGGSQPILQLIADDPGDVLPRAAAILTRPRGAEPSARTILMTIPFESVPGAPQRRALANALLTALDLQPAN